MRIVFLDIDGVLNGHERFKNGYCGIRQENVKQLNALLEAVSSAEIVISSSWRYMIKEESMTIDGFSNLLLSHGVNCLTEAGKSRIIGHTPFDESIGGRNGRGAQIKHWMFVKGYDKLRDKHVVLDDMMWDFEKHRDLNLVLTDPGLGLQSDQVTRAIQFLFFG